MDDYKVILGVVPTSRGGWGGPARAVTKKQIMERVTAICEKLGDVEIVDIDPVLENGILCVKGECQAVSDYLISKHVDAVFFPHVNFGQEEAVATVARAVGKPVLLWGPRDPAPEGYNFRIYDTQCGMFATSKALLRYGVTFTYIENCWLDSPVLDEGIDKFVRVASVVKSVRGMRVGQIGVRPRPFLSVSINEGELLEKFGIEVAPVWPEEIVNVVKKLQYGMADSVGDSEFHFRGTAPENAQPDPRIAALVQEWKATLDCSSIPEDKLEITAAVELAIMEIAKANQFDAVAMECWSFLSEEYGIRACFMLGDLIDHGLVAACETDIHAAITARMMQAATRGKTAPFIADLTIRHPTNDNAELLWHCGPFAKSLKKEGVQGSIQEYKGFYELKGGDITVARLDQLNNEYMLFADEVVSCDGPVTNGNYIWVETNDWPTWEKKLMYGPYIHHIVGIHGKVADVLKESCRYLKGLKHDSVNDIKSI